VNRTDDAAIASAPSARTSALWRRLASASFAPGAMRPPRRGWRRRSAARSASWARGQRRRIERLDRVDARCARRHRRDRARCRGNRGAAAWRPPVVPLPKNGSSTRSPAFEAASITRARRASGFCVGWVFSPLRVLRRSPPVQIGNSQSERIWQSSFAPKRFIIEGVALGLRPARGPDHGLVGVGEAAAAKIRMGLVLRQTMSFRIQNPRSCMMAPTRKILW